MKQRAGLQKKISSIFGGIPLPGKPEQPPSESSVPKQDAAAQAPEHHHQVSYDVQQQPPEMTPSQPFEPVKSSQTDTEVLSNLYKTSAFLHKLTDKLLGSYGKQLDPRQKKMAILTGGLAVVLVLLLFTFYWPQRNPVNTTGNSLNSVISDSASDLKINYVPPNPLPDNLRDPMGTGISRNYSGGGLTISGIVVGEEKSMVIIGGNYYYEGQEVSGDTIVKINNNSVEFETKDGKRMTLQVGESR